MKRIGIAAVTVALVAGCASTASVAAVRPQGTIFDTRVKTVNYNPDDVVTVAVRQGTSTLIQLDPGENVESAGGGLGIGDSNAWTIGVRGSNIFLKPKAKSPDTNITLVTSKRTYAFALRAVRRDINTAYIVRFKYPAEEAKKRAAEKARQEARNKPHRLECTNLPDGDKPNIDYKMWGDTSLAPTAMWDDGQTTCLRYPHATDLPAIYSISGDGSEQLTNMSVHGNTVMIHGAYHQYRLRDGNQVLGIKTNGITAAPYNARGTTSPDVRRELKRPQGEDNDE